MSACILESRGVRGKGENVEGGFMKCDVGASSFAKNATTLSAFRMLALSLTFFASKLAPTEG
ncbi:hypothetical protein BLL37_29375 [Pseudomonas azotoformans]|uniref:Uncharacterized protein n=1 Tax=Pseudomonas azotoformans TaxID=47878 RepID=A0A1V2J5W0_PSEAZ|nr:hypothetical protein BFL39_24575 [Pseudomonas azotoformans]ONH40655.1 hypothetical protein BLL37_29375 [Pseudomonas azotoformans]